MTIQEHVPLAPLTTFGIGGRARFFICAKNIDDVAQACDFAQEKKLSVFILGGGANIVVDDAGFDGLVIKIEITGVEIDEGLTANPAPQKVEEIPATNSVAQNGLVEAKPTRGPFVMQNLSPVILTAGAGEPWDALVARAVAGDLWGIENLSGIPGTLGGASVQNIGAYGAALSQVLEWVDVYDTSARAQKRLTKNEYASGYRDSIFKKEPGRYVVLRAALRLFCGGAPNLTYRDLAECFGADTAPTLAQIRAAVLEIRAQKFPDLSKEGTAGSFFKNPIVTEAQAQALKERYPAMPLFALPESAGSKVPLGWLLDYRHGVIDMRGVAVGGARMYERQYLVMVAQKNTSSQDVDALARIVQQKVRDACGLSIEREVCFVAH